MAVSDKRGTLVRFAGWGAPRRGGRGQALALWPREGSLSPSLRVPIELLTRTPGHSSIHPTEPCTLSLKPSTDLQLATRRPSLLFFFVTLKPRVRGYTKSMSVRYKPASEPLHISVKGGGGSSSVRLNLRSSFLVLRPGSLVQITRLSLSTCFQ